MRILFWASWLLLAVRSWANDVGLTFEFPNLVASGYELQLPINNTVVPTASSILNYTNFDYPDATLKVSWDTAADDFVCKDAILATGDTVLARGYDTNAWRDLGPANHQFQVDASQKVITLNQSVLEYLYYNHRNDVLFFQLGWTDSSDSFEDYGSSPLWAIAGNEAEASSLYSSALSAHTTMTMLATTAVFDVTTPVTKIARQTPSIKSYDSDADSLPAVTSTSNSSSSRAASQSGLTVGAIVGIAIGGLVFLVLFCVLPCWIFLRRRRQSGNGDAHDAHTQGAQALQDMLADKEAQASQDPDTPYSEQPLNQVVHNNESTVSLSIAGETAALRGANGSLSSSRPGSAAYSSLRLPSIRGTAASTHDAEDSPTQTHAASSLHERSPSVGSPVTRSSMQQERALSPSSRAQQPEQFPTRGARAAAHNNSTSNLSNVVNADEIDSLPDVPAEEEDDPDPPSAISAESMPESTSAPQSGEATPQLGKARLLRRSETPGGVSISDQYAHLVEDGMTQDEIWRLEEEERALDEAIERHRADSRATER